MQMLRKAFTGKVEVIANEKFEGKRVAVKQGGREMDDEQKETENRKRREKLEKKRRFARKKKK